MIEIYNWLINQLQTNMFSSGALIATLTGSAIYTLRNIPNYIKTTFFYFLAIEVTIKNDTDLFDDLCLWFQKEGLLHKSRRFQLYDHYKDCKNQGTISFSEGFHWFWYKGRPVFFNKTTSTQPTGMYKIPETIHLIFLFRRDKLLVSELLKSKCAEF